MKTLNTHPFPTEEQKFSAKSKKQKKYASGKYM